MTVSYKLKAPNGQPVTIKGPNNYNATQATLAPNIRCPHCMHMGTFAPATQQDLIINHVEMQGGAPYAKGTCYVGVRLCPNPDCRGIVFVVMENNNKSIALPYEVLDFDGSDIPPNIVGSLEEAVKCHSAQCYKAAALMVRRVLEELCDERGAKGDNLKSRIENLSTKIVVPKELIDAADHLRLLGNDAAHIEAKTYDSVGEQEVKIAIALTKELLKAAYQYKGLLKELTSLQRKPAAANP